MSDAQTFWFHCGRCGGLFRDRAGEETERICAQCGQDPSTGIIETAAEPAAAVAAVIPEARSERVAESGRGKRTVRKRRHRHLMLKLVAGWSVVLVLIVVVAKRMWQEPAVVAGPAVPTPETKVRVSELDTRFLEESGPRALDAFSRFLAAGTPEERNQFVLDPMNTAGRMVRFYSMNPLTQVDAAGLRLERNAVLELPGGKAIETHWAGADGRLFDAVFREEQGEWRLDWEHYARFSEAPWALFLAGSGASEGEFRLLARERLAEERKGAESISVVFYAPRFGYPDQTGFQSPEFLVSRSSPQGRRLDEGFKLLREGKRVFGSTLPSLDPEGMIRVRVRVKRIEEEMDRRFEVTAVNACHWYSVDDPGVADGGVPEDTPAEGP